jgi:hypothetical protein
MVVSLAAAEAKIAAQAKRVYAIFMLTVVEVEGRSDEQGGEMARVKRSRKRVRAMISKQKQSYNHV